MEDLLIQTTDFTPEVRFSLKESNLSIKGKSLPEDARVFYNPLIKWLKEIPKAELNKLHLEIYLTYFNSSSAKQLLKTFYILEDLKDEGVNTSVSWLHDSEDHMIKEKGEELADILEIEFEVISK